MILITGGGGFIGRHLVNRALTEPGKVTVIDKKSRPSFFPSSDRLVYVQGDVSRIRTMVPFHRRAKLRIIHLAAETSVRQSVLRPLSSVRANVGVTCALLEFARKVDAESFVFASSAAVYGDKKGPCRENDLPNPRSPYAASKLAGEYYCRVYSQLYGIPITVLRYFNVYGPGQSAHSAGVITGFLKQVSHGRPPVIYGDGRQTRDFVFVSDVVTATVKAVTRKPESETVINIGTGRATSIGALAWKVLRLLGRRDLQPIYVPSVEGDVRFSQADVSRARRKIGFRPRYDIDTGLKLTRDSVVQSRRPR